MQIGGCWKKTSDSDLYWKASSNTAAYTSQPASWGSVFDGCSFSLLAGAAQPTAPDTRLPPRHQSLLKSVGCTSMSNSASSCSQGPSPLSLTESSDEGHPPSPDVFLSVSYRVHCIALCTKLLVVSCPLPLSRTKVLKTVPNFSARCPHRALPSFWVSLPLLLCQVTNSLGLLTVSSCASCWWPSSWWTHCPWSARVLNHQLSMDPKEL